MAATSIDQQFIEYIVKSLVGHPDDVVVDRIVDEKGVLLTLTVHPEDLGRVIGKRGATAQSLRSLLRALGTKNDARYNLKIVDVDRPEGERDQPRQAAPAAPAVDDTAAPDETTAVAADDSSAPARDTGDDWNTPVQSAPEQLTDRSSDLAAKTRQELAEYDDLDI